MRLDIEEAINVLQKLQKNMGSSSGTEPIRTAAIALHFIWGSGHLHNFEDCLACLGEDAPTTASPAFDTREQAEEWLQQPMEPHHAHRVAIAGRLYSVGYSLEHGVRFLIRVPDKTELDTPRQTSSPLLNEAIDALHRARRYVHAPTDMEFIDSALLALHFILENGQLLDFERFVGNFDSKASFSPLCSFATREQADTWLSAHPRPPHGAQVGIAGQRYSVGYSRDSGLRVLVRQPSLEELDG
ncbi:hypothetical protein JRI60_24795 [Archangium violaceum]|uniref:hypothetical protein n=1 Tax=Archangium violaceum TaxID=83451 RepID=UPI001951184C|nr:hypothetical protein [Archangium violaceum]QRO02002.1 hypothetical protein JRI60_24795 [Archangium violaceum]